MRHHVTIDKEATPPLPKILFTFFLPPFSLFLTLPKTHPYFREGKEGRRKVKKKEEEEKKERALDLYKPPLRAGRRAAAPQAGEKEENLPSPARNAEGNRLLCLPDAAERLAVTLSGAFTHFSRSALEGEAARRRRRRRPRENGQFLAKEKKGGQPKKRDVARASVPGVGRVSFPLAFWILLLPSPRS
uniref:Uncharacterized protein n=1 Tax=Micrurus lemniscatus lemniscatus TaxID=129467 RepID=A0A2D4JMS8_MICLE